MRACLCAETHREREREIQNETETETERERERKREREKHKILLGHKTQLFMKAKQCFTSTTISPKAVPCVAGTKKKEKKKENHNS